MRATRTMRVAATARRAAPLLLIIFSVSSTGCRDCEVTDTLYEPYSYLFEYPERFDQWLREHPAYFNEELYACMDDVIRKGYAQELVELRECDRWASDADLLDVCRRGVANPETADAILTAMAAAAQGNTTFASTTVGQQLIFTKAEDLQFWEQSANEVLRLLAAHSGRH